MNIRITRLTMTNFKCFRDKEVTLDGDIITVRGRNGAGKTTIADAILFCLFGKSADGQSDLELFKTREDGKVIPNLDHSVELVLETRESAGTMAQGLRISEITLRRSIKEVWVKKSGSEESVFKNNTVEYYVNGESYTKTDYEKYIASLVDEKVFRAITNPNYFPSLKWQDQRAFLTQMVGEVKLPSDNEEFADLQQQLDDEKQDIATYLKHLKYQIKKVKDKLDKIPVRLEEQNKALPDKQDWLALRVEYDAVSQHLKELEDSIIAIRQGNGSDLRRADLRVKIDNLRKQMNDIEDKARDQIRIKSIEQNRLVSDLSIKFNLELNNQRQIEQAITADERIISRCQQSIKECDEEIERLRLAWPNRKFTADPDTALCPTCGQPLPEDQLKEKLNIMRENFNKALADERQALSNKAKGVKETKAKAQQELQSYEAKFQLDTDSLTETKEKINAIFSEKQKAEKQPLPTLDDFLPCNEDYQLALREKSALEAELSSVTDSDDNTAQLAQLDSELQSLTQRKDLITQQLAMKKAYDRGISLIEGIKAEQKELIKQLSDLEKLEDIARSYQSRQNAVLESLINERFSLVSWRLFRTVNNGGDSFEEPYCECYVYGIPYHSGLNQAMRLNAGLDICEALCRFHNVAAPIVIDNAESNLDIYKTTGQQIRLQVYDSDLTLV